jgi:N utilization substance protein B
VSRAKDKKSREIAFQIMFSSDTGKHDVFEVLSDTLLTEEAQGIKSLITDKVQTWEKNRETIDKTIESYLKKGSINDIASVAKAILRLGLTEMEYIKEVPCEVAINEAVEITKKYGDEDLARFVNGVLDARLRDIRGKEEDHEKRKKFE